MEQSKELPKFDPDFSPDNIQNREAAKARKLKFDPNKRAYTDEDGSLVCDQFGQPY